MTVDIIQVDTGVPVPEDWRGTYPIDKLEIGESFLFPLSKRSSVQTLASKIKFQTGRTFTVRKQGEDTARVWRTS